MPKAWWRQNPTLMSVLVSIVGFLIVQGTLLVIWGVKLEDRVSSIEGRGSPQLSAISDRLTRVEVRLDSVNTELTKNANKLDRISDKLGEHLTK